LSYRWRSGDPTTFTSFSLSFHPKEDCHEYA
jgi:hypothetical protein